MLYSLHFLEQKPFPVANGARALPPTCAGVGAGAGQQRPTLSGGLGLAIVQLLDAFAMGLAVVMDLGLGRRV